MNEAQMFANKKSVFGSFGNMSIDLISGLAVGGLLGYYIDKYLETLPLFLVLLGILGMVAGFWNFYKDLMKKIKQEGRKDEQPYAAV